MARTKFRYQAPYNRIYRVGGVTGTQPECQFISIQNAIDRAFSDGFNNANNPALIEVYEKGSPYFENLTLRSGVSIVGIGGSNRGRVNVTGHVTYAPVAGDRNSNRFTISNINFNSSGGGTQPAFLVGGTNGLQIYLNNCAVQNTTADGQAAFVKNGPQPASGGGAAQARIYLINTNFYVNDAVNVGLNVATISGGRYFLIGNDSSYGADGAGLASIFNIAGDTQFYCAQDCSDISMFFGQGGSIFYVTSSAIMTFKYASFQAFTSPNPMNIFNVTGAANILLANCLLQQASSGYPIYVNNAAAQIRLTSCLTTTNNSGFAMVDAFGGSITSFNSSFTYVGAGAQIGFQVNNAGFVSLLNATARLSATGSRLVQFNGAGNFDFKNSNFIGGNDCGIVVAAGNNATARLYQSSFEMYGNSVLGLGGGSGCNILWSYSSTTQSTGPSGSYNGFYGLNEAPANINVFTFAEGMRYERNNGDVICYVGYNNGFVSIQAAMDFCQQAGFVNAQIMLAGNTVYNESLTFSSYGALKIVGTDARNAQENGSGGIAGDIRIVGNHQMNSGSMAGQISFYNVYFDGRNDNDLPIFNTVGTNFQSMKFTNCSFTKGNTARSSNLFNFYSESVQTPSHYFDRCNFYTYLENNYSVFHTFKKAILIVKNCEFSFGDPAGVKKNQIAYLDDGSNIDGYGMIATGETTELFSLGAASFLDISFSKLLVQASGGQLVYYRDNTVAIFRESHLDPRFIPGSLLARDGVQATALISFIDNTYAPGDGYDVNGAFFVNGLDFPVGPNAAQTAINLALAINQSINAAILNKIYAVANGTNVNLYAWNYGAAANGYGLGLIAGAPATITPWSGGANGAGGQFSFGACSFGNNRIQASINSTPQPQTTNSISA